MYTSQSGINPMAMIPLSNAIDVIPFAPDGIVKDIYNHIVAITFPSKSGLITLPVVDDGMISISSAFVKHIYLDWDDYKPAPVDEIIKYYKNTFEPLFGLYPGYTLQYIVKHKIENKIVAIQLANGIYIPAAKDETKPLGLDVIQVEQFEWSINKQISDIKSCGEDSELRKNTYHNFEELYQQFRLMVSNWITGRGSEIRKGIEDIIFNPNLPEYEKRKRLHIVLHPELYKWFYSDKEHWESPVSFLRKDCRIIDGPDACTGSCFWNHGRCLLHVEANTNVGENRVSTSELFIKRIIDELVRFPNRRKQLMKRGEISKVSLIVEPIIQGDQYIIPESSLTWTNLLRLDWSKQIPEEPKYYEEMSRDAVEEPLKGELPPELEKILGKTNIRLKQSESFVAFQGILGITIEQLEIEDATKMNKENLIQYVKHTSKPVGLIDSNGTQFIRPFTGSFDSVTIFVFLPGIIGILIEEEGNATIKISSLPEALQEIYENAGRIRIKKIKEEPLIAPLIIGQNPIMAKPRRRPLVSRALVSRRPRVANKT
jgi:hypothetical protein